MKILEKKQKIAFLITCFYIPSSFIIFLLCVFKKKFAITSIRYENLLFISIGLVLYFIIFLFIFHFNNRIDIKNRSILISCFIFFVIQVLFISNYYFHFAWDISFIEDAINSKLFSYENTEEYLDYLSTYPNNLLLCGIFYLIEKCVISVGVWYGYAYFLLLCVIMFISQISSYLLYMCLIKTTKHKAISVFSFFLFEIIICLSPWISAPYSDSVGIVFPLLAYYIYLLKPNNVIKSVLRFIALGFILYTSYHIKPQASIMCISVIALEFISITFERFDLRKLMLFLPSVALGLLISILLTNITISSLGVEIDENKAFGPAHFFMMGLNDKTVGAYACEDIEFSQTFDNKSERSRANISVALERIKDKGIRKLFKLYGDKLALDYSNGSFSWWEEREGFVREYIDENGTLLCNFVRNIYYNEGKYFTLWQIYSQIVYLPILIFVCFAVLNSNNGNNVSLLLCYMGIFAFNILFETRGRYIFCNASILILLSSSGMESILELFQKQIHTSC